MKWSTSPKPGFRYDFTVLHPLDSETAVVVYCTPLGEEPAMAQVSFRIDDNLKSHAESIFNSMGMNLSTAITIFIRQTIDRQALPFDVRACTNPLADPARIRAAAEDYRNGKRNYHLHELPPLTETVMPPSGSPNPSRGTSADGGAPVSTKPTD